MVSVDRPDAHALLADARHTASNVCRCTNRSADFIRHSLHRFRRAQPRGHLLTVPSSQPNRLERSIDQAGTAMEISGIGFPVGRRKRHCHPSQVLGSR
jgi:hypothetical protein